jgi:hypothetical protein
LEIFNRYQDFTRGFEKGKEVSSGQRHFSLDCPTPPCGKSRWPSPIDLSFSVPRKDVKLQQKYLKEKRAFVTDLIGMQRSDIILIF